MKKNPLEARYEKKISRKKLCYKISLDKNPSKHCNKSHNNLYNSQNKTPEEDSR